MFSAPSLTAVSGRKLVVGLTLCVLAGISALGCQKRESFQTVQLSKAPIHDDQAMALRDWNRSNALWANGFSHSGHTYYPYAPSDNLSYVEQTLWTPALFYGQTLALPITLLVTPPTPVANHGDYVPPSYTAVQVAPNDAYWFQSHKFTP